MGVEWNNFVVVVMVLWKTLKVVQLNVIAFVLFLFGVGVLIPSEKWKDGTTGAVLSALYATFFYAMSLIVRKEKDVIRHTKQQCQELNKKGNKCVKRLKKDIIALNRMGERIAEALNRTDERIADCTLVDKKVLKKRGFHLKMAANRRLKKIEIGVKVDLRRVVSKKFLELKKELQADVEKEADEHMSKFKWDKNDWEVVKAEIEGTKDAVNSVKNMENFMMQLPQLYVLLQNVDKTVGDQTS